MPAEILTLYKELGETPLECLKRFKSANPAYAETKMTYLGRLDPMAEGLLLVLAGDTRSKEQYLSLDKTYEFEVLWGFETDTYDVLGKVSSANPDLLTLNPLYGGSDAIRKSEFASLLKKIQNIKTQKYPTFSSKSFGGDFMSARDGKIEEAEVQERGIKIFSITHVHTRMLKGGDVLNEITERINKVKGDFRQKEILRAWNKELRIKNNEQFLISKFAADVSSGTYIRSLAHEMGKMLNSCAIAYNIKRTRIGEYKI